MFKGIRVPMGFYTQRGEKVLITCVRVPGGFLTPVQLRAIAEVSEKLNVRPHITDRQDIQLHGVRYEDSINVLEFLKDYNLSTIGGGNKVRNVTVSTGTTTACAFLFRIRATIIHHPLSSDVPPYSSTDTPVI